VGVSILRCEPDAIILCGSDGATMSHAFISYNQADKLYASKLAVAMEERGLPVRLAERLEGGAQWENGLRRRWKTVERLS
jgi:hypothetical protein